MKKWLDIPLSWTATSRHALVSSLNSLNKLRNTWSDGGLETGSYHSAFRYFFEETGLEQKFSPPIAAKAGRYFARCYRDLNFHILSSCLLADEIGAWEKVSTIKFNGLDKLKNNNGKGLVVFSYHTGPYTIIPYVLMVMGFKVNILVRSDQVEPETGMSIDEINARINEVCNICGFGQMKVIDSQKIMSLIQIKKALKRGELILLFPDTARDSSVSSIPVPFFNRYIYGHAGLAKLFKLSKANFYPILSSWKENGRIQLDVHDSLNIKPNDREEDIIKSIYSLFEDAIIRNPAQWTRVQVLPELLVSRKDEPIEDNPG